MMVSPQFLAGRKSQGASASMPCSGKGSKDRLLWNANANWRACSSQTSLL